MPIQFKRESVSKDLTLDCEVVVIGTGAGGSVVASRLAEAGVDVIMVEEGGYYTREDFGTDNLNALNTLYRDSGATVIMGNPPIFFGEGRCVGGSSVLNAGISWRTPERILHDWVWESGIESLKPEALDPYFTQIEADIEVNRHNPGIIGRDSLTLKEGADKMGYQYEELNRNTRDCQGSGVCYYGCPTGAKRSPLETFVPRALNAGARLVTNCRVDRVLTENGRATGIEGVFIGHPSAKKGPKVTVRAQRVVVSCGAIQTPRLLMMSKLAGSSGQLGRNLSVHPNAKVVAEYDHPVEGWKGSIQGYHVREFMDEGFTFGTSFPAPGLFAASMPAWGNSGWELFEKLNHLAFHGVLIEDTSRGGVALAPGGGAVAYYNLNDVDYHTTLKSVGMLCEMLFAGGAKRCYLPFEDLHSIDSPDEIGKLFQGLPKARTEYMTVHAMGTARMGSDPKRSVVNSWGETHDVKNLFVADASVFPGPVGCNPMVSIMTLASRTAAHILEARAGTYRKAA